MATIGTHCILELYECPPALLNDHTFVTQTLRDAVEQGLATLLREVSYKFDPQGVTALGLLAESHISIHTWPERQYAAVDVFTCGSSDPEAACRFMVDAFQAGRHDLVTLKRAVHVNHPELANVGAVTAPSPA